MPASPLSIVVLISGGGSNLQAIIDAFQDVTPAEAAAVNIKAVISNRPEAKGLQRAQQAQIHTEVIDHRLFAEREIFDQALQKCIDQFEPDLLVLAGFMRLLSDDFVNHYLGRIINIHPSLLPDFKGLNTHQRALEAKVHQHGASVHFVSPDLDGGPVILQAQVAVHSDDNPDTLAAKVLLQEHIIYPTVIRWFAEGRLDFQQNQAWFDHQALLKPMQIESDCHEQPQ